MKVERKPYDTDEYHDFREYMADYLHDQQQATGPKEIIVLTYWGHYPEQGSYSILANVEDQTPCPCCNQQVYKIRDCSEIGRQFFITTNKKEGV